MKACIVLDRDFVIGDVDPRLFVALGDENVLWNRHSLPPTGSYLSARPRAEYGLFDCQDVQGACLTKSRERLDE